jgi:hypothetical protein
MKLFNGFHLLVTELMRFNLEKTSYSLSRPKIEDGAGRK